MYYRFTALCSRCRNGRLLQPVLAWLLLVTCGTLIPHALDAGERRPNIIFMLVDDVSAREISTYGGPIEMPNLDRLANAGVRFNTAWATPKCAPTRAMLMTG